MKEKIIYYKDPLNDDFAGTNIKTKHLSPKYKYIHNNPFWNLFSFVLYRLIAKPIIYILMKMIFSLKIKNRKVLNKSRKTGAFLYGNHTHLLADAFVPNILTLKRRNYVIAGRDAMSIPVVKHVLPSLGVLPLPETLKQKKEFLQLLKNKMKRKGLITVYPEAHIWPYYTKIRPFPEASFKYALILDKPIYAVTNCYQKRKFTTKPRITTFIDGPFYPQKDLSKNENALYLRNCVYEVMTERSRVYSTYEYIIYEKIED